MTNIYAAGYPKSGTTWLSRLIADTLNCPLGGSCPTQDDKEAASEGWGRELAHVVRKGHYKHIPAEFNSATPFAHTLAYRQLGDGKVVFIVRHPFDVAVSAAAYHGRSVRETLEGMATGRWYKLPPWNEYVASWLDAPFPVVHTRYEALLGNTVTELQRVMAAMDFKCGTDKVRTAVRARSFAAQKAADVEAVDKFRSVKLRLLREGKAGGWCEFFGDGDIEFGLRHFGESMRRLGYAV